MKSIKIDKIVLCSYKASSVNQEYNSLIQESTSGRLVLPRLSVQFVKSFILKVIPRDFRGHAIFLRLAVSSYLKLRGYQVSSEPEADFSR